MDTTGNWGAHPFIRHARDTLVRSMSFVCSSGWWIIVPPEFTPLQSMHRSSLPITPETGRHLVFCPRDFVCLPIYLVYWKWNAHWLQDMSFLCSCFVRFLLLAMRVHVSDVISEILFSRLRIFEFSSSFSLNLLFVFWLHSQFPFISDDWLSWHA
jgi:hypothetical protein